MVDRYGIEVYTILVAVFYFHVFKQLYFYILKNEVDILFVDIYFELCSSPNGETVFKAVCDESTAHIQKLVSNQKSSSKKKKKSFRGRGSFSRGRGGMMRGGSMFRGSSMFRGGGGGSFRGAMDRGRARVSTTIYLFGYIVL